MSWRKEKDADYYLEEYSSASVYFCFAPYTTLWILMFSLIGVNIIFYIFARIKGDFYSSTACIIISILENVLFTCLVMGINCLVMIEDMDGMAYIAPIFIYIPVTIIMNFIILLTCSKENQKNRKMIFIPKNKLDNQINDVFTINQKAHANPPLVCLKGTFQISRFIYKYFDYVPYQSWQADSKSEEIPEKLGRKSLLLLEIKPDFTLSSTFQTKLQQRQNNLDMISQAVGAATMQKTSFKIYNLHKKTFVKTSNLYFAFLNSCFGKFIFGLSHIFGLSAFLENIYGLALTKASITVKKSISDTNEYPIPAYSPDVDQPGGETCETPPISQLPQYLIYQNQIQMNNYYQAYLAQQQNQQMMMMNQQNQQMMMNAQNQQMMMNAQQQQIMMNNQQQLQQQQQQMMMMNAAQQQQTMANNSPYISNMQMVEQINAMPNMAEQMQEYQSQAMQMQQALGFTTPQNPYMMNAMQIQNQPGMPMQNQQQIQMQPQYPNQNQTGMPANSQNPPEPNPYANIDPNEN